MITRSRNYRRKPAGKFAKTSGRVSDIRDELKDVKKATSAEKLVVPHGSPNAKIRVVPVGGLEEVGRNMMYLEYVDPGSKYHGDIIVIDIGLQFPDENMPGIDYIIPNITSLLPKKDKIKAVIITHAHYDHIGGIPHVMPKLGADIPLYGTDLTLAIIAKRQRDYEHLGGHLNLNEISNDTKLDFGAFQIEFFGVSHNIPGSVGVILHTPVGILIHTGDFKIDTRSGIGGVTEMEKLRELGEKNVLLLMSDSTNAREPGHQFSEVDIQHEMEAIIRDAAGRLIIGTFASLLGRLNEILQIAEKYDKRVAIDGRSMKTNIEIAEHLGYIKVNPAILIDAADTHKYPSKKVVVLVTGAQGEENAVLMRIVTGRHKFLKIQSGDTVVFSSSVIPGNERSVQYLTDKLYRDGADVINYKMLDIHAGGHAKQEDLKLLIETIKPQYLMPIEGNHSFLKLHAKVGRRAGMAEEKIVVADNGQVAEVKKGSVMLTKERVPANYVMVDGLGVGDVQEVVLRDRQMLASDGIFVIIATVDSQTGKVRGSPDIISRGFVYLRESKELLFQARLLVKKIVEHSTHTMHPVNWTYVRDNLRDQVGDFLFEKTHRRPMVLPVVIEV
ncbi:MAG: ribonuclease J [Candidatus Niyogibacteria bacterium]|nr:ribonuclease J [Candidatus Niyogibacteria bacterium]